MDSFFDKEAAAESLEEYVSTRREALANRVGQTAVVHLADIKVDELGIAETGQQRKDWRLCISAEEEGEREEVVVRLQGVMTKNNLVPRNASSCGKGRILFLSQYTEISGLGTPTFDQALAKISCVVDKFEQHLAGAELGSIPEADGVGGRVFSASNRLFTLKSDAPTEQDTEFQFGVDPLNVLHKLKGSNLIHAPENIVRYYRRDERDGMVNYRECTPGLFKAGDIVELQVCFVAVMTAHTKVKVTTRLQAVTLLSSEFSKLAAVNRSAASYHTASRTSTRRRVGYFQEDEEDERKIKRQRTASVNAEDQMQA